MCWEPYWMDTVDSKPEHSLPSHTTFRSYKIWRLTRNLDRDDGAIYYHVEATGLSSCDWNYC